MSSAAAVHAATTLLAVDDNKVTPGVLGFLVFAVLGIGTWWILKFMTRSLGRVNFVEEPDPTAAVSGPGAGAGQAESVESAEK